MPLPAELTCTIGLVTPLARPLRLGESVRIQAVFAGGTPSGVRFVARRADTTDIPVQLAGADLEESPAGTFTAAVTFLAAGAWAIRAECEAPTRAVAEMKIRVRASDAIDQPAPGTPMLAPGGVPLLSTDPQQAIISNYADLADNEAYWAPVVRQSDGALRRTPFLQSVLTTADKGYATLVALQADLTPAANTTAVVRGDGTAINNGYYIKNGASGAGSWTKVADIPVLDAPVVTAVGGVANAITGNASKNPAADQLFLLTPLSTNTSTVTLALNAGVARSVRNADGTQLVEGQLVAGRQYLLQYQSNNTYRVHGLISAPRVHGTMTLIGSAGRFLDFYTVSTNAAAHSRVFFANTGDIYFYSGGDGATALSAAFGVEANGNVRAYQGAIVTKSAQEVFHPRNPPPGTDDAREQLGQVISPWWEGMATAGVVASTRPYSVSGADLGKRLRVTASGAWLDFETMPVNTEVIVDAQAACTLYSGYSGATWRVQGGTRLSVAAGSMVWVLKGQADLVAFVLAGSAVAATPTVPPYGRKWAWAMGQSWNVRGSQNAMWGVQAQLLALGLNRDVLSVQGASFGASAISRYAPTDPNNYYWDRTANAGAGGPGPNLTAAIAAINAAPGSPPLSDIIVMIGLNDLSIMAASGAYPTFNTVAGWKADFLAALAYLRTQLSLPGLRAWICPLPAQDLGTFSEAAFTAMRRAQLDLIAEGTNIYRGPDSYDLPRPFGDRHYGFVAQAEHGARVARFITNQVDAQSNYLGPKITAFARTAAKTYRITIDLGVGAAMQRPVLPDGFALLRGGDPWATPLTVAMGGYAWSGNDLIITTTTDDLTAALFYPYGSAGMTAPSRIVRAQDPVNSAYLPLQTYHPTA